MADKTVSKFAADAYFLGPKSENGAWVRGEFQAILEHWFDWRRSLFADDPEVVSEARRLSPDFLREREILGQELRRLLQMLCAEVPKYTPRYIGHMVSELSLPALFGHFATLLHNPNNTSREVAKIGARMESEAIAMLAQMLGYDPAVAQGHFTGGGTVANFEAVWRARYRMDHALSLALVLAERDGDPLDPFMAAHMGWRKFEALQAERKVSDDEMRAASIVLNNPYDIALRISNASGRTFRGPVLITPGNKHFSWRKAANLLGLGEASFWNAPLDGEGRVEIAGLKRLIDNAREEARPIVCLASVAGTTEAGDAILIPSTPLQICSMIFAPKPLISGTILTPPMAAFSVPCFAAMRKNPLPPNRPRRFAQLAGRNRSRLIRTSSGLCLIPAALS